MLHLHQSYCAHPSGQLLHLVLPHHSVLLFPSANTIIILDPSSLALLHVLAFSDAFPHSLGQISSIAVDPGMKLIVAAMHTRLAAWSLSGVQQDTWRIHSTLILPPSHTITAVDSKSGLLAVGTHLGLSVYTLILDNDLPTWSQKWTVSVTTPLLIRFAPSLMYIATLAKQDNAIRLYSTTSGRLTQLISHPRSLVDFSWRHSKTSSRADSILYTVTKDSVLRIFLPVLDSPQLLQLHASLDLFSSLPFSIASNHLESSSSNIFWMDREVLGNAFSHILNPHSEEEDARSRRIAEINKEGWDLFLRILGDGSITVTAVANIDRRPPTLLKQFTLQQLLPSTLSTLPAYLYLFPNKDPSTITLAMSPPLTTYILSPLSFFDAQSDGLRLSAVSIERVPEEESDIVRLVRAPEGWGVGVMRASGGGEAWRVVEHGSRLVRSERWKSADHVVVLEGGRTFATYTATSNIVTLHSTPAKSIPVPALNYLFSMPSKNEHKSIFGITPDFSIIEIRASHFPSPSLTIHSQTCLPLLSPACATKMILPVDPMAWAIGIQRDVLLSVSEIGELAFWVPEENGWRCTGKVKTGRTGIRRASCSSAKKTALIVSGPDGDELTIWDSQESEFATGLEYRGMFSETIHDLDWTSTPDAQSILAVGFLHHVALLCQQRMTYFDEGPGWALCTKVDIGNLIPYPINDSIWLANGSLLVAAGHQMFLYGASLPSRKEVAQPETLFEYVARQNGPLEDHHPQMLLQCLLWEKVELAKEIIVNLARDIENPEKKQRLHWTSVPIEKFLRKDQSTASASVQRKQYMMLFNSPEQKDESDDTVFSRPLVTHLIEALEASPLPHLTPNEQAHLLVLIQTTLEIDEQRRALDSNGLRYLISMRSFYILNSRGSAPSSPVNNNALPRKTGRRERIRYRDMVWAFHSESQELLLNASIAACNGRMGWSDARALGVPIWLTSIEMMKAQIEVIARNEYMAGENRDPVACSLLYFALGKVKLVHGLWRQAAWHKEQVVMLNFLSHDFTEARWRTAALKNAYALISKQRFEYAAAFFLLGGALQDAVNICLKQLGDFQLAVALARVVEQSNEGPILLDILRNTVLPIAFKDGNRWLGSWAFWLLNRRDLAVRILLTPLQGIADALQVQVAEIGEPHYDDPSLALLFSQLRSKTLQTAKGTSEISGRSEFNFVLQMARVFCRMGCHVLALDLVRSWSFERPSIIHHDVPGVALSEREKSPPPSPSISRRSMFDLASRRRSSILIDMQIISPSPTRSPSPGRPAGLMSPVMNQIREESDFTARKIGLGHLMKSAQQDVQVPEFDMSSFS